jgi:hypothetical protein
VGQAFFVEAGADHEHCAEYEGERMLRRGRPRLVTDRSRREQAA